MHEEGLRALLAAVAGELAALLTMLNSCSPGVAVVNIDNGYGAASMAHRIRAAAPAGLSSRG